MKNVRALENKIREAIEDAIWQYEMDYDEEVSDVEMEAHLLIDEDGSQTLSVDVYD